MVATMDVLTWTPMLVAAQPMRPACSKVTTSAEKVEKVVKPPQKPVMMNNRHSGATSFVLAKKATAKPMI